MAIEAVLFDSGGVLVVEGQPVLRQRWADELGLTLDELAAAQHEAVGPGWKGGRTEDEIAARFRAITGLAERDQHAFDVDSHAHLHVDPVLRQFVERLRPRYRVGVVSNNGPHFRSLVATAAALDELVDDIVVSCEVGITKPDPRIYEAAAEGLGVRPEACVFVDDQLRMVEGARAVGMTAIHHVSSRETLRELRACLGMIEHDYDAAGGVVFDAAGRMLVLHRPSRGEVRLPKGHIEDGEDARTAAVREVGEESGYVDVEITAELGMQQSEFDAFATDGPGHHVVRREHYFAMRLRSERTVERDRAELKFEPAWMAPEDALAAVSFPIERRWVARAIEAARA